MKATITLILLTLIIPIKASADLYTDMLDFATGIIVSYGGHEVGHALAAYATNTETVWYTGSYNQPLTFDEHASSNRDGTIIHMAGLLTHPIMSEMILQSDLDKNSSFVRGMMFFNIVNPILYMLDYRFIRRTNRESDTQYRGDLEGVEHYAGDDKARTFAFGMAALAAIQGYRFIKTQTWCPAWIRRDDMRLNLATVDRGMALMVEIDF